MERAMGCSEAVRHLWEFLDEGLGEDDRHAVEEHLAFCMRCCGELEFAKHLRELLRGKGSPGLPDDVRERVERFIDDLDDTPEAGGVPR